MNLSTDRTAWPSGQAFLNRSKSLWFYEKEFMFFDFVHMEYSFHGAKWI